MTFRAFCDLADWDSVGTEETNKIETPHVVLKSDNTEKSQTKTVPTTTDMNAYLIKSENLRIVEKQKKIRLNGTRIEALL